MKKVAILLVALMIVGMIFLNGCQEQSIYIKKLEVKPDNFVNMSEEQIIHFPHLKEAIFTNKTIDISDYDNEEAELIGIFSYFDTNYICYQNAYNKVEIWYAD